MPNETYFRFLFLPKFLNGRNAVIAKANRTRFLRNVWKLVRWITSPKQPQSVRLTGLNMAKNNVSTVKKTIIAVAMIATCFLHTPLIIAAPRMASASARTTAVAFAVGSRNVTWKNLKYPSITRPAPTGSSSLNIPASRNTTPIKKAHSLLSLKRKTLFILLRYVRQ